MKHNLRQVFVSELAAAAIAGDIKLSKVADMIKNNQLRLVQHSIYCSKATGGSTTIRMTDPGDTKLIGINNFATSQLADNQTLLVTEIRILAVVLGAAPTPETIKAANFVSIKGIAALQNGEIDVFCGSDKILEGYPLSNFITDNNQSQELGTVTLGVPKFFPPKTELRIEIRTGAATDANCVIKVEFLGAATIN